LNNYKLINAALGDKNFDDHLNLFPLTNSGASSFLHKYSFFNKTELVKIITLDEFLEENKEIKKIDLIKIDVEGYELKTINGMKKTLKNKKIFKILIDYHMNYITLDEKNNCEKFILSCDYKIVSERYNDYSLYQLKF